jgi:hypothetical protein
MERKNIGPEAVALACDTINKCKADTATARRILAQAHAWVCDPAIDPTWKPEPVKAADLSVAEAAEHRAAALREHNASLQAEVADLTAKLVKLGALVTSKDQEIAKLNKLAADDTEHQIIGRLHESINDAHEAMGHLDGLTRTRAESVLADRISQYGRKIAKAAPVAVAAVAPAPVVPAVVPVAPTPRSVAPVATSDADPYGDLPPNVREYLRKREASKSTLEID